MANPMLSRLRAKDKKGLFTRTQTAVSYRTGFAPFDYRNGYMVQVMDLQEKFIAEYPSVGVVGGSFITIVGKSGTAKTTFAIQMAANIIRPFASGFVQHYDLEQATTYTRIKNVTGFTQQELDDKFVLKQEKSYIEDIFDSIMEVVREKEENREDYMYDTGLMNEFNQPIRSYVPTVMLLDSIPTVASKPDKENKVEMEGGTYSNRVAKALAQFYKKLTPIIKQYNIIVIAINHINQKIEINPFAKSQPQLVYMKMDESIPGGNAPIYYAHNLIKFVTAGKLTAEEDGFDGFKVRAELLKSRTNKAGQFCHLMYNQELGFDPVMSQYQFALDNDLVAGRNPYRHFGGEFEGLKFDSRKFRKEFINNKELQMALYSRTVPLLEQHLSKVDTAEQAAASISQLDVLERLEASQHDEVFDEEEAA